MAQVLFVSAGRDLFQDAFAFILSSHQEEPLDGAGLFFSPIDYKEVALANSILPSIPYLAKAAEEKQTTEVNQKIFGKRCELQNIKYHIRDHNGPRDKNIFAGQSRFSDLVMLSSELFYSDIYRSQPN